MRRGGCESQGRRAHVKRQRQKKRSLSNANAHKVIFAKALQLTAIDCETMISAPSIQLEFEMPYRFEFSTASRRAFAGGGVFCCPIAAAIFLTPSRWRKPLRPAPMLLRPCRLIAW
jgi:hypothetical protein